MIADVKVIGAGIVGAACAEALAAEKLKVVVIETGLVGGGATAAGMGHITVMDDSEAQFALTSYSRRLWNQRRDVARDAWGTIWLAADEVEMGAVRAKAAFYSSRGARAEILDARQLAEAEPELRSGLAGGLLVPDDSVIYAPVEARRMIERAGVSVLSDGGNVSAAWTVVATGAWTKGLPIRARKGHLAITDRYPGFLRHQLVELGYLKSAHGSDNESVAFNVQPRGTGQVLIGSSRQYGIESKEIDMPFLGRMLRRAVEYMPGLERLSVIRAWTGFRAATPDGLPVIGPSVENERVYYATGHEGLGITTSLGTARLIADHMMGRAAAIPIEPYLPERFHA